VLKESAARLVQEIPRLREATSFDELLRLVDDLIRPISGIGEMAVYDTAHRIGARFGLEPEKVYLHRDTREGAVALGFDGKRRAIEMHEFPDPIRQRLKPHEAEDLLCIYQSRLRGGGRRSSYTSTGRST
jgi:hypothetical protein